MRLLCLFAVLAIALVSLRSKAEPIQDLPAIDWSGVAQPKLPGSYWLTLVGYEPVQQALKVTPEQSEALRAVEAQWHAESNADDDALIGLDDEKSKEQQAKNRVRSYDRRKAVVAKIREVLDAEQAERLEQISRRVRSITALEDEDVATALKLTKEQQQKLDDVRDAYVRRRAGALRDFVKARRKAVFGRGAVVEQLRPVIDKAIEQGRAVLTDEQREKFDALGRDDGLDLFYDEVATSIGATEEQKVQLADIYNQYRHDHANVSNGGPEPTERRRIDAERIIAEIAKERLAVLTEEQRAAYEKLLGEPFEIDFTKAKDLFGRDRRLPRDPHRTIKQP